MPVIGDARAGWKISFDFLDVNSYYRIPKLSKHMKNLQMLKRATVVLVVAFMIHSCSQEEEIRTSDLESATSQVIKGKYIIVLDTDELGGSAGARFGGDQARAKEFVRSQAIDVLQVRREKIEQVYSATINGFSAELNDSELRRLREDKRVKYIEEDRIITLAPPPGKGPGNGGGGSSGQETPYGIAKVGGPVNYTGNGVAWVIDTGIDLTHPDLNVSTTNGFTAFTSGKDADLNDGNGHGTHVAGTIAAINNDIGVVGVAAGATVIPVKVLNSRGSGSYSGVIAGVDHVGANGKSGDVANMSLGGPTSQALDDAVKDAAEKGIIFTIAAGNSGAHAGNYSPARVNGNNIYTISAMNSSDVWASFSNYGNPPVDYCAPGVSIKSTWKGGGYNTISGTSMAAPHAAGVLLLGSAKASGTVSGDPDGNSDPIISR
jgi:hypothetical protein